MSPAPSDACCLTVLRSLSHAAATVLVGVFITSRVGMRSSVVARHPYSLIERLDLVLRSAAWPINLNITIYGHIQKY